MDLGLSGKRALICGGSSGLGRAVATALVAEGAHVALLSRDAGKLQAVADELNAMGPGRAVIAPADLADHASLLTAVDVAEAALGGPIEILLNNTGGPPPSGVSGLEPDLWRAQFEAMVLSIFRLTDRVLPGMKAMGWGRILNVASITVVEPVASLGVSNTLRASVTAWAKTLAERSRRTGSPSTPCCPAASTRRASSGWTRPARPPTASRPSRPGPRPRPAFPSVAWARRRSSVPSPPSWPARRRPMSPAR
jgi:NAD(P)-dependent dehydrogenase (short-subunit alcohol dehydrogenase family)